MSSFFKKLKDSFSGITSKNDQVFKVINIYSPIEGIVINQKKIPDECFCEGYVGVGVGIQPLDDGEISSPLSGKLEVVFKTYHAYIIRESFHNVAVMLHLGINTVNIPVEEKAFQTNWKQGEEIKEKEVLCQMDLSVIRRIMKESKEKKVEGENNLEEKFTSDISVLLVQPENMEDKKVEILKKDGEAVSKGELLMRIVSSK